jgi:GPH family glycoside/pentoside/hexuronide:cation symporter
MISPPREAANRDLHDRLTPRTRLAYGVGEMAGALPTSVSAFFFLFFLTNVAGLSPTLAGAAVLCGKVWDAFSDPLVGWMSDRTQSPLGRRYPWMLAGAIPLAIGISLQWLVPPVDQQWALFGYYTLMGILTFTSLTAVMLPFSALAAELTHNYNERITLISFKSAFSIGGSILGLAMAQVLFARINHPSLKYLAMGSVNGVLIIVAVVLCVAGTWARYRQVQRQRPLRTELMPNGPIWRQARDALSNPAFRWVMGLYLCSWTAVQGAAVVLPYFVVDWMGLPEGSFVQMALVVQGTAVVTMVAWNWLGRKTDKRTIYFLGMPLLLLAQGGLFLLQPGQVHTLFGLAAIAGVGTATVYLVPWSMLPDVVDLDEVLTGQRREGIFYGFAVFIQKIGIALAVFLNGRVLDWTGYLAAPGGELGSQPPLALLTIRLMMGPVPALLVLGGGVCALFYPITRRVHHQIRQQRQQQMQMQNLKDAP